MSGPAGDAIEIEGLVKRYDGRTVIDELTFGVRRGEIFALLGPNGAGKTTTVETIEGYRRPDGGRVRVLGLDPARDERALRGRLGLMLQGGGIYPQARPRELVRLFARFYARPLEPDGLLDRVGLGGVAERRYKVLSGGEKQRLSLALALVGRPDVAVLDEPTAGMDPEAKATTRELIAELRSDGVTVLLTTHELADVERLADRLALIDRGRLVALGTPEELLSGGTRRLRFRAARALTTDELEALAVHLAATSPNAWLSADGRTGYRLDGTPPTPDVIASLTAWCAEHGVLIVTLEAGGGSLEERYLELVGSESRG